MKHHFSENVDFSNMVWDINQAIYERHKLSQMDLEIMKMFPSPILQFLLQLEPQTCKSSFNEFRSTNYVKCEKYSTW